jgi:hypothetical protein
MSSERTITQEHLNSLLAEQRHKFEQKMSDLQKSSENGLADTLQRLGVTIGEGESVESAAERWCADATARIAQLDADRQAAIAQHDQVITPLIDRAEKAESQLREITVTSTLTAAAVKAGAFNVEQMVLLLRDKTTLLPNGEVVVRDFMPAAMQSPDEVMDYLSATEPNYFKSGLKEPESLK